MTNLITLRTIEEQMNDYKPIYQPILPLFISDSSKQYPVEAGKVTFSRAEAIGDLRAKMFGPKDTELHQIHSKRGSKDFKKYFFGAQYIQSQLQNTAGYESVVAQVLEELNKQADEIFLTGEGTANNNVVNNGLYYSNDPLYVTKASYEVEKDTGGNHLVDLYAKMVSIVEEAQAASGRILVVMYGDTFIGKYNGLFPTSNAALALQLKEALSEVTFAKLPKAVTPSGANGFMVINLDQVTLHYTTLPVVDDQGVNAEKKYAWTNFIMGSSMLDLQTSGAVIRQPITFEA